MANVNKVILVGNVARAPEVKDLPSGQVVATFSMATNEKWKGKDGQQQEHTEWHRIQVWGKLAEICAQYLSKGRQVYVEGKIRTRKWTKDGVEKQATEINADEVVFLGGGKKAEAVAETPSDDGAPF